MAGTPTTSSLTITLPSYCPTNGTGADTSVTWCTRRRRRSVRALALPGQFLLRDRRGSGPTTSSQERCSRRCTRRPPSVAETSGRSASTCRSTSRPATRSSGTSSRTTSSCETHHVRDEAARDQEAQPARGKRGRLRPHRAADRDDRDGDRDHGHRRRVELGDGRAQPRKSRFDRGDARRHPDGGLPQGEVHGRFARADLQFGDVGRHRLLHEHDASPGPTAAATASTRRFVSTAPSERSAGRFPARPRVHGHAATPHDPRSSSRSSSTTRRRLPRRSYSASRPLSIRQPANGPGGTKTRTEMDATPVLAVVGLLAALAATLTAFRARAPRGRRARAGTRAGAHGRAHRRVEPARARGGARVRAGAGLPRRRPDRSLLPRRRPVPGREQQLRVRNGRRAAGGRVRPASVAASCV